MTSAILNATAVPASQTSALPAIETLHQLYAPRIFRFLLGSLRDRDLAETLTQDTFVRAWAAREQFRGECAPATWLTRIALNLLRDHTRTHRFQFWKQASKTSVEASSLAAHLPHPASSSEAGLIAREQIKRVWESVQELSERQRTIFLLRFVEEMELSDIASITSLPVSTVKTHLYRALATIRARHAPGSTAAASSGSSSAARQEKP